MRLAVEPVRLTLRRPLVSAWGELSERELLLITLTDPDGLEGRGEAAPLEPYDGVAPAAVRAVLD
ncbi:MAG: mandelate racemase/muconate lactonizing enzyme family protein, partial [Solirubrobacteraceae bacterium]